MQNPGGICDEKQRDDFYAILRRRDGQKIVDKMTINGLAVQDGF